MTLPFVEPFAVALALKGVGALAAAAAAGGALLLPTGRGRAYAALAALALTPTLVIGELWHSAQITHLRAHLALALAALAGGAILVALLARLIARQPSLFALLAFAALPFRIPVESGTTSADLLVPLYVVLGAGILAYAHAQLVVPRRARAVASGNGSHEPSGWREHRPGRLDYVLIGVLVLYALQSLYSSDFEQALKNIAFFYVPFALLFKLLTSLEWRYRNVIACLGIGLGLGLLFAGIGLVEYGTRHVFWNQRVIASNEFESYFRVNSLFFDPSIYGRFLAIVMIGLATTLLWPGRKREVWFVAAALAFLWGGIVFSFSQSSFAALLVGLAVLAGLRFDPRPVLAAAVAVGLAGLVVVLAAPNAINLNLGSSGATNGGASSGRFKLIRGGLTLFSDRPLWGYGSGAFASEYRRRVGTSTAAAASASHTIPLTVAAEQGVIGLVAYVLLIVTAARVLLLGLGRLRERGPPRSLVVRAFVAAAFAALFVHTLVYADFLEDPVTWALLALAVVLRRVGYAEPADLAGVAPGSVEAAA